ncbi:unnamed protein product [Malus baccata var. baccata]
MENNQSIRSGRAVFVINKGSDLHGGHSGSYDSFFNSIPPGCRFKPLDEELVGYYLRRKIANLPLPPNIINEVELDKTYRKGTRPDRAAGNGYWKATGVKKDVMSKNVEVGFKTSLVFYEGKSPRGKKTNWLMHEFNVKAPPRKADRNNMRLDDWVLCRVYMKANKAKKFKKQPNDEVATEDNGLDYDGVDLALQNPNEYPPKNSYDNPHPQNPNHQSYLVYPPQNPYYSVVIYQSCIVYPPQNPNHQSYLNSNHNGYYSCDGYNLFSNTNAMGSDGLFKEEPFPTILPPQDHQHLYLPNQNSLQFNGYQPHQRLWG